MRLLTMFLTMTSIKKIRKLKNQKEKRIKMTLRIR